jgi:hypothetical protein
MPISAPATAFGTRAASPRAAWDFNHIFLTTFGPVALAAVVTALPVFFHLASQAAAIGLCVALALIVAAFLPTTIPTVVLFSYLFQNLFVAWVSPEIQSVAQLDTIRAYGFLLTVVIWFVLAAHYWLDRASFDRRIRFLMTVTTGAMVLIGLYFLLGLAIRAPGAVVYLRNIASPILLLQIFALVAYRHRLAMIGPLTVLAVLTLAYGYLELFSHDALLSLVHGDTYMMWRIKQDYDAGVWVRAMHETGFVMRSYRDALAIDFLNTPLLAGLDIKVYRLLGPNFHSISFAYALAVLGIILGAARRWWYTLLTLPLLLVVGSKGALIAVLFVGATLLAMTYVRALRKLWPFLALLALFAVLGIITGLDAGDYHVIGFFGGLRGFLSNPFGHGIGVGGNLSLNMATVEWSRSQQLGHTSVAVESAVGVLLYQMGIAAFGLLAVFCWVAVALWRLYRVSGDALQAAAALGVLTITVNGIFQEEALFAPLALATMMAMAGWQLGTAYRRPLPGLRLRGAA